MTATAARPETLGRPGTSGHGAVVGGTGALVRLALRRDRIWWPAWLLPVLLYTAGTAGAFEGLYPTPELRATLPVTMGANPTLLAFYGHAWDITTPGGFTAWRIGWVTFILAGLMSIFTVLRHTREEEESGRLELVRSTTVGRHASLAAALLVTVGGNLAAMLGLTAAMMAVGMPAAGSLAFGATLAATGLTFGGVGAVCAQLSESTRSARGMALATLGLAFLLRAVGDSGTGASWLSWLSPLGWANQVRPYAGNRFVVLTLPVLAAVLLLGAAVRLESRRDFAAGVIAPRLGAARAPGSLSSAFGLAWRLHRATLIAWTVGMVVFGATLGTVANGILDLFADNPALADIIKALGGNQGIVDAYLAASLPLLALMATSQGISAVLRIRAEEGDGRAELVLATPTSRRQFAGSHLAVALVGSVVLAAAIGLGAGIGYAAVARDPSLVWHVFGAALTTLPAMWVLIGVAVALVGWLPRWSALAWAGLAVSLLLGQVGRAMRLPEWALQISPFAHLPQVPGLPVSWTPLAVLTLVAAALIGLGLAGFRSRDIG